MILTNYQVLTNSWAYRLIYLLLITLLLAGVSNFSAYNYLPATVILEFLFITLVVFYLGSLRAWGLTLSCFGITYIVFSFFFYIAKDSTGSFIDFIYIYKSYYYFSALAIVGAVYPKKQPPINIHFRGVFNIILFAFAFKYILSYLFGISARPGVLTENNFELMGLLILYASLFLQEEKYKKTDIFVLLLIFLFSGSRSGIFCFLFFVCVMFFNWDKKGLTLRLGIMLSTLCVAIYMFVYRLQGMSIEDIDRVRFLNIFLYEISDFDLYHFLFGAPVITELSNYGCSSLSYYSALFSDSGYFNCYSVVLHSFILRTLFDHGIVGFLFLVGGYSYLLAKINTPIRYIIIVLGVSILNGFSVSSFNSVYFALPFLFFILVNKSKVLK